MNLTGPPRLLAFRLDGRGSLPKPEQPAIFAKPDLPRPGAELAKQGAIVFETKGCNMCHGAQAHSVSASVPDLRHFAFAGVFALYEDIVRKGMLSQAGMPNFGDAVSPEELKLIQAMVLNEAWDAHDAQEGKHH